MTRIDRLLEEYSRHIAVPWTRNLAGAQKVLMLIHSPEDERRLRGHVLERFREETEKAGHGWLSCDFTDLLTRYIATHDYREEYFRHPDDLTGLKDEFNRILIDELTTKLAKADDNTVVALHGVAEVFGLTRLSDIIRACETRIRGRLLVLFPGDHDGNNFRLLGARDGWDYHAVVISHASLS